MSELREPPKDQGVRLESCQVGDHLGLHAAGLIEPLGVVQLGLLFLPGGGFRRFLFSGLAAGFLGLGIDQPPRLLESATIGDLVDDFLPQGRFFDVGDRRDLALLELPLLANVELVCREVERQA